jgi:hypothetical protein
MRISDFNIDPCGCSMNCICRPVSWPFISRGGFQLCQLWCNGIWMALFALHRIDTEGSCMLSSFWVLGSSKYSQGDQRGGVIGKEVECRGYNCNTAVEQLLPGGAVLVYQVLSVSSNGCWRNLVELEVEIQEIDGEIILIVMLGKEIEHRRVLLILQLLLSGGVLFCVLDIL